jgi:hypothetical protein
MVTFLFLKNVKTHNKTIEGSGNYLEETEYKQIFFKGFIDPESLVTNFDVNTIIQATGRFVVEDGKEYVCRCLTSIKKN